MLGSYKGMEAAKSVFDALFKLMDAEEARMFGIIQNVLWGGDPYANDDFEYYHAHDEDEDDDDDDPESANAKHADTNHCHGYSKPASVSCSEDVGFSSSRSSEEKCPHHGPLTIGWRAKLEMLRKSNRRLQALVSKYERFHHRLQQPCINVDQKPFYGGGASSVIQSNDTQLHRPTCVGGGMAATTRAAAATTATAAKTNAVGA